MPKEKDQEENKLSHTTPNRKTISQNFIKLRNSRIPRARGIIENKNLLNEFNDKDCQETPDRKTVSINSRIRKVKGNFVRGDLNPKSLFQNELEKQSTEKASVSRG